jgi:hypothetical protein
MLTQKGKTRVFIKIKSTSPFYEESFKVLRDEAHAKFPDDAPQLQPDVRYYWKVEGTRELEDEPFA